MHRFINTEDILSQVSSDHSYDLIIGSGAWGEGHLVDIYFNHIQRNHKLCLDKSGVNYEYVFITNRGDYDKYKDRFIIPDITFIFTDNFAHLGGSNGIQFDYANKRERSVVLMASDCFHTPNLIPNLLTKFSDKDAVCVMSQRVFPHEFLADLKAKEQEMPYEEIFEPRQFLKLCLPSLHIRERNYFMDNYIRTGTYGSMMYPVRKDGVLIGELIRSFHLGYVFVKKPATGLSSGFLDSNPFVMNFTTPDTVGVVADSDDGFCIDVANGGKREDIDIVLPAAPLLEDFSQITACWRGWRGGPVCPVNESLMGYNIALHSESLNQEWLDLAKKADDYVTHIYDGEIANKPLTWGIVCTNL